MLTTTKYPDLYITAAESSSLPSAKELIQPLATPGLCALKYRVDDAGELGVNPLGIYEMLWKEYQLDPS